MPARTSKTAPEKDSRKGCDTFRILSGKLSGKLPETVRRFSMEEARFRPPSDDGFFTDDFPVNPWVNPRRNSKKISARTDLLDDA
jgi:hypothetical protein